MRTLLLLILVGAATLGDAPTSQPDAIASALDRCLNGPHGAQSTYAMEVCYQNAIAAYDALLAKIYPMVLANVDPQTRAAIATSQKSWVAYRDAEMNAYGKPWSYDRGTIVNIDVGAARVKMVHDRIAELYLFWPGLSHGPDTYPFTSPSP